MAGVGEVEITLDGKTETLRPSLGAAKKVNAAGGFQQVLNRLLAYDMDFYVTVVAAGMNKKPQEVEEAVYTSGLYSLVNPLALYVGYLANGGKPVEAAGDSKSGES
ncbi:hypothetical protein [Bradyrhizobium sp. URHD0069]|uniref:hypothetical protein n=1 Tax=Bradyrhizobium sp. URHD0069 TaxID=1380355 RepID=UPI000496136D|nr:hypothetical protein [Bradyrhizobium sp. URHD0069]